MFFSTHDDEVHCIVIEDLIDAKSFQKAIE